MVLNANDVQNWKDFPKGLRVLLLNGDADSSTELRSKLEQMDYLVHTFHNEKEALSAIASESESFFHIAIVEVSTSNCDASFWFLENVKDLPTIMTSNIHCLSTMMKCISLGAVEFMNKPLSEDKLRNIWQHVVHKAFNARESTPNNSQLIITESAALPLLEEDDNKAKVSIKTENISPMEESDNKYPAPSTPQLEQGARLLDDGDCCQDQTNYPIEKEGMMAIDGESKFVENTCRNALNKDTLHIGEPQSPEKSMVRVEQEYCTNGSKKVSSGSNEEGTNGDADGDAENIANKALGLANSGGARANRKKMKVDWTPNLHKKFVKAVEQLGVDQAIPSRILELMNVEGLTRHNVASHLQKYRMQKRHILPREDGSRLWQHQRDHTMERRTSYYPPLKPIMAYPPYHSSSHAMPVHNFAYPVWGQPNGRQNGVQIWGPPPCYPPWQPPESEQWTSYVGMNADTWGCPVMPPSLHNPYYSYPQSVSGTHNNFASENNYGMRQSSFDLQLAEEIIDKVVKEAMNKPWLPLPLGLKPPSTDSVLSELTKQGISTIPPHINGYKFH